MYEDTKVSQLVINHLTEEKFKELLENNELDQNQLYMTDDNVGYAPPLLSTLWSDHLLNDMSWLRADTFSWQSGDVYVAAYNHLVADFENIASETLYAWNNGVGSYVYTLSESPSVGDSVYDILGVLDSSRSVINVVDGGIYVGEDEVSSLLYTRDSSRDTKIPQTETIGDITITYYRAEDGHKICLPDQEDNILALYEATGVAWYYILDEDNTQFKLPRMKPEKRLPFAEIANADVNGYVAYSQGYGDSGGIVGTSNLWLSSSGGIEFGGTQSKSLSDEGIVNTSVNLDNARINNVTAEQYLYFYVGNFERDAIEQTAGVTTETLNGKADVDLSNMNASQSAKDTIIGWSVPDYSAGVAISQNTDFICPTHGVIAGEVSAASYGYCNIIVNGTVIMQVGSENNQRCRGPFYAQIQKGDVVYLLTSGNAEIPQSNFYPFKGVN